MNSSNASYVSVGSEKDPVDTQYDRRNRRFSIVSGVEGRGVLDIAGTEDAEEEHAANALHNDSSSVIKFYPEWCQCIECLKHGQMQENATCMENCRSSLLCPPQGPTSRILAFMLVFILGWAFCWVLFLDASEPGEPSPAEPRGPIFALGIIEIVGLAAAILMKFGKLPSLLGPLLLGILIRNVDSINLFKNLQGNMHYRECDTSDEVCKSHATTNSTHWIKPIRQFALTMILTRAGLEMSPKQLRKLKGVVPLLAFGPCIVEASACALFTWVLFGYIREDGIEPISVPMCFVSGFALAAVSPAVVVPGMVSLKKKNLGVGQAIPTLLIAASSIDDVLAISAYTIFLGIALAEESGDTGSGWEIYAGGPLSIVVGVLHGLVVGIFLHFIPSKDNRNKAQTRLVLLLLFNLLAIFGYELYELLSGAGSLCTLVTSFIASFGWRSQAHWKRPMRVIERQLAHLWTLCVPLLFGTIGREIDFTSKGFTGVRVGKIIAIIFLCLLVRCFTAFLIAGFAKLNKKERLFCAMAWIPKATVQAALAPLVLTKILDKIERKPDIANIASFIAHGEVVVTTAVIAIILTAPLGSILISFFGPILLRTPTVPEQETLEDEFPNGDGIDPAMESKQLTPFASKSQQIFMRRETGMSNMSLPASPAESNVEPRNSVSADAVLMGNGDDLTS